MTAQDIAAPAILLAAYALFFVVLLALYTTKQIKWKSRYSFVFSHVVLRLVGMALGVAFAAMNWGSPDGVLIAYLVFSAEGYFSLILCAYRFLVVWQQDYLGVSNLEPRVPKDLPKGEKFRMHLRAPLASVHWALIAANALIISGSSIMAGTIGEDENTDDVKSRMNSAKGLRVAGTAIFLAIGQAFLLVCIQAYRRKGNRTLLLIMATWPFLTIRGVYGIITVLMPEYSYASTEAYAADGFTSKFLAAEHCMGTLMEWSACGLLLLTHFSKLYGEDEMAEDWSGEDKTVVDGEGGTATRKTVSTDQV
ncbi:hypothetical protein JCM10207_006862 [Rhodosporidiobolus poonsookiae]